jgi:molybdenum cofactor cytidylyltransferase
MRAAILLAAGASRRFGRSDKLRARIGRRTLLDHALDHALAAVTGRVLLVAAKPVQRRRVVAVRLRGSPSLAGSLAAGISALRPVEREVLIFLADMPFATAPWMRLGANVAERPGFRGRPGHPVLARVQAVRAALARGGERLGHDLAARIVPGAYGNILDVDTPAALRRARLHGSRALRRRSRQRGDKACSHSPAGSRRSLP